MSYQEVIIIGAPRSGTNMLRDVICRLPGFGTWPCDEINYIWRHGNARWPSDELPPELATPEVCRFLDKAFARRARAGGLEWVVEKTCANSLRVPFIDRALPDSLYLFIHRHPLDAVPSAMKRWRASLDLGYTLKKARFVPLSDVPYYGWRFVRNRLHRLFSSERRVASWGPRHEEMDRQLEEYSLPELCAAQWSACAERAAKAFLAMPPDKVLVIAYEEFVSAPSSGLQRICDFLAVDIDSPPRRDLVADVSDRSVGRGRRSLDADTRVRVGQLAAPGLEALAELADSRR